MSTTAVPSSDTTGSLFVKEIRSIMHAFGDNSTPLPSSIKLVEIVLQEQLHTLLSKAISVASHRGSEFVGTEDILFLMRKDRVKINRLLNYLGVKDFESSLNAALSGKADDLKGSAVSKKMKTCLNFLEAIDETGELTDSQQPFDAVKHERNVRAEIMSRTMDKNSYFEYFNARCISFTYHNTHENKIYNWLITKCDIPELPKNNPLFYDILAYLAYETVAQIVDLALLVRQDGAVKLGDTYSYYVAGYTRMPGSYPAQYTAELGGKQVGLPPPITPSEIKEAMRRFYSPQLAPWSPFSRTLPSNVYSKLLIC